MAFATRDPFLALIEDRSRFIEKILALYPQLHEEWEKEQINFFRQEAKSFANGDKEVEDSVFRSLSLSIDESSEFSNLFYQSILLLVYAHYASTVTALASNLSPKTMINAICKSKKHKLSQEASEAFNFIEKDFRCLRNNVCHNNSGTTRNKDKIKDIAKHTPSISFDGNIISIESPEIIEKALQQINVLLKELCNITGHKVKRSNTKTTQS